jgi:hypothetical protein
VPRQSIQPQCAGSVEERSLLALDAASMEQAVQSSIAELEDLNAWPPGEALVRLRLLHLRPDLSELQLCMPHIVSDDASITIAFEDLSRHYLDAAAGREHPRAQDGALARFVADERNRLRGRLEEHTRFWETYFEETSPIVFPESEVLPADAPSEAVYLDLPASIVEAEIDAARTSGLGLAEILQAALLRTIAPYVEPSRRGGKQPVLMTPRSLRHEGAGDRAIGFFAHMDCLKADVADAPDLLALARRLRRAAIETAPHQRIPLEVKSASLHRRRWLPRDRWCRLAARTMVTLMRAARLDEQVALAHARLVALQRNPARDFTVIANVLRSFVSLDEAPLFGLPLAPVAVHPGREPIRRVLQMYFLREPHAAGAYRLALSGDLTASFRQALARNLIADLKTSCARPMARGAALEEPDALAQ